MGFDGEGGAVLAHQRGAHGQGTTGTDLAAEFQALVGGIIGQDIGGAQVVELGGGIAQGHAYGGVYPRKGTVGPYPEDESAGIFKGLAGEALVEVVGVVQFDGAWGWNGFFRALI